MQIEEYSSPPLLSFKQTKCITFIPVLTFPWLKDPKKASYNKPVYSVYSGKMILSVWKVVFLEKDSFIHWLTEHISFIAQGRNCHSSGYIVSSGWE